MSIVRDEARARRSLGDRKASLYIRVEGPWWCAVWQARASSTSPTGDGLLRARGLDLAELMREIVAADEESVAIEGAGGGS